MVVEKSSKATVHAPSLIRRSLKLGVKHPGQFYIGRVAFSKRDLGVFKVIKQLYG
jgi:hypothetical protein